jgi:hypothetical protein
LAIDKKDSRILDQRNPQKTPTLFDDDENK